MAGVNKVILLGNLGSDPEVRTLPSGGKVVTFSIATSESYNNKEGVRVEQTEWHRIELWDNLANIAEQYLKKGDTAYIEGRIRTEKWTDKENIERTTVKIRANSLQLVGGRRSGGGETSESGAQSNTGNSWSSNIYAPKISLVSMPPPPDLAGGNSDDLPF
jgi:single-strand DNA-binding protein